MKTLPLFFLALSLSGCAIEEVTTEIRVRDPGHASLVRTDAVGSRRLDMPADGTIVLNAPSAKTITSDVMGGSTFAVKWCTPLYREPRGVHPKYDIAEPECVEKPFPGTLGYSLQTPWENVRVVEHRRPEREMAWGIGLGAVAAFGSLASVVFLLPASQFKGGAGTKIALGTTTAAIGGAYAAAMIPTIAAPDLDLVIIDYERPRYIAQ